MNAAATIVPGLPVHAEAPPVARAPLRFTLDGDAGLETHLGQVCALVRSGVKDAVGRRALDGILLGGGYGRGEGGVRRTASGDRPYNDLEFYVLLRGSTVLNDLRFAGKLAALGHELSSAAGVEVEFKVLSRAALRRGPVTMFSYDLVSGHRWVTGHESLLEGCGHHADPTAIPLAEATRLLMNRCSGLLFARDRLDGARFEADDADFVGRNLAKARLALGDAVLTAFGRYHWSCRERSRRLPELPASRRMPWLEAVRAAHVEGVAFKLHPVAVERSTEELAADLVGLTQLASRVWLWLESRRLGASFSSPLEYALHAGPLCPDTHAGRNLLVNLRRFGWRGLTAGATRYPRERLLRALPVLLWHPAAIDEAPVRGRLQRWLRCPGQTSADLGRAYRSLWEIFR
jgi:hypothetical protein